MIKTELTREDALRILQMGEEFHKESHFAHLPFSPEKCWSLLESTLTNRDKRFIAFDSEYKGFIIMQITEHFFTNAKMASDFCLYIAPEHRGGTLFLRLIREAAKWAVANGAQEFTIYHNTGIKTEAAPRLFEKIGMNMAGYIFTQGLDDVRNH